MKAFKYNEGGILDKQFIRVFDLYKNDIYRLVYSYTKNKSDSDDITQNTFIKLYNHNEILRRQDEDIKKWLIKVAINECKTFLLSSWKKKIIAFVEKQENTLSITLPNNDLLEAILQLPKRYRIIIFLYYYEDYKIKEISEMLNLSITNIQTILSRARKKLKEILKEAYK